MSSSNNKRVFGQATRRGPTRYQRQLGQKSGKDSHSASQPTEEQERAQRRLEQKLKKRAEGEALDERYGYIRYCRTHNEGRKSRRGWVFNILPTVGALCSPF